MTDSSSCGRVGDALIALCGAFASGSELPVPGSELPGPADLSPEDWKQLVHVARPHGLTPLLHLATVEHGVPDEARASLKRHYVAQTARNIKALHELDGIADALHENGIDAIALKGAHILPQLYADVGCRPMADLDLMIREESVADLGRVMESLGYRRSFANCPSDMDVVNMRQGYRPPFEQPGRVPVDVHTGLLDRRADGALAVSEMWAHARPREGTGTVRCLSPSHFLAFSAWHYMKHMTLSYGPLFALADMMLALREWRAAIDWAAFWQTANRWKIGGDVAVVMATLNDHWQQAVPLVPDGTRPLSARELVHGVPGAGSRLAAEFVDACHDRLRALRSLPSLSARLRYIRFWLSPSREALCMRYGAREDASIVLLTVRHLGGLAVRLVRGLAAWVWLKARRLVRGRDVRSRT